MKIRQLRLDMQVRNVNQHCASLSKELARPFYWNTNIEVASAFFVCDEDVKKYIIEQDPEVLSLRFAMDDFGRVVTVLRKGSTP